MESLINAAIGVLTGEAFVRQNRFPPYGSLLSNSPHLHDYIVTETADFEFDAYRNKVVGTYPSQYPTPSAPSKPQEHGR